MIRLFINALAATAGGGLTYVRNVIPHIATHAGVRATILVDSEFRRELGVWDNVEFVEAPTRKGAAARFWFEQRALPSLIRRSGADVLLSTGNFALLNSPVPQILLSRNALYTSSDFMNDLRQRGDYRLWLDTELKAAFAKCSIRRADVTVAPSAAFAEELRCWTGMRIETIHHGFDATAFAGNHDPLPVDIQDKLAGAADSFRLLFVSHYNYYRNFETLLRALPLLRDRLAPRKVRLVLTCRLSAAANPGSYDATSAAVLIRELGVSDNVIELGFVPYRLLHHVYRDCNVYVTPAYAESFAHPLVEAMASGLPIVASNISVHREICRNAAIYFEQFSPEEAAAAVNRIATSPELAREIASDGLARAHDFSWGHHLAGILGLASDLVGRARVD